MIAFLSVLLFTSTATIIYQSCLSIHPSIYPFVHLSYRCLLSAWCMSSPGQGPMGDTVIYSVVTEE